MKKILLFALIGMLMAGSFTSCKNKNQEPTQEEVQEMKQALADSVLAQIDALADEYLIASENRFNLRGFELTEKEKQVKPDYLLDPAEANKFVTKSQKVNALAIYVVELDIRRVYEMPIEETKEAIAKLAMELNYPINLDQNEANTPLSERIRMDYEKCKENGDLACFWQFNFATTTEASYILAQNPELFFSKISEEQWQCFRQGWKANLNAIITLAKYDEEMASLLEFRNKYNPYSSDEEKAKINSSVDAAKQFRIANKDKYIAKRNALLQ